MNHEEQLQAIRSAKLGDEDAWRELLQQYDLLIKKFLSLGEKKGRDLDDLDSRLREVFVMAVRNYDPSIGVSFYKYLHGCFLNCVRIPSDVGAIRVPRDAFSDERFREQAMNAKAAKPIGKQDWDDGRASHEQMVDQIDQQAVVQNAMKSALGARERRVLKWRFKGETFAEIGNRFREPSGRMKNVYLEAIRKLKLYLGETK